MEIGSDYNLNLKLNTNKIFFASGRIAIKNILNYILQYNDISP